MHQEAREVDGNCCSECGVELYFFNDCYNYHRDCDCHATVCDGKANPYLMVTY